MAVDSYRSHFITPLSTFQELGLGDGNQYAIPKGKVHEVYAALCASARYREATLLVDVHVGSRGEVGDVIVYQAEWEKDEKAPESQPHDEHVDPIEDVDDIPDHSAASALRSVLLATSLIPRTYVGPQLIQQQHNPTLHHHHHHCVQNDSPRRRVVLY